MTYNTFIDSKLLGCGYTIGMIQYLLVEKNFPKVAIIKDDNGNIIERKFFIEKLNN